MTVAMLQAGMLSSTSASTAASFGTCSQHCSNVMDSYSFCDLVRVFASVCSGLTRAAFVGSVCTRVTGQVVFARAVPFSGLNTS